MVTYHRWSLVQEEIQPVKMLLWCFGELGPTSVNHLLQKVWAWVARALKICFCLEDLWIKGRILLFGEIWLFVSSRRFGDEAQFIIHPDNSFTFLAESSKAGMLLDSMYQALRSSVLGAIYKAPCIYLWMKACLRPAYCNHHCLAGSTCLIYPFRSMQPS